MTPEQQQLVLDFRPAAEAFVRRKYRPRTKQQLDDFFSAAYHGLVEAAVRFDPNNPTGTTFWGYARWWVFKLCNEQIGREDVIRQPRAVQRGEEPPKVTTVPLDVETRGESLPVRSLMEDGYSDVEQDMMMAWAETVLGSYSSETRAAWLVYRVRGTLPFEPEAQALVLLLDEELTEGLS